MATGSEARATGEPLGMRLRSGLSGQVFALCLVIFIADIVAGIIIPTFSLFARDVGISLAVLGAINTLGGTTQLVTSIPLGVLSDRVGRKRVVTGGLLAFAGTTAALAVATGLPLITLGRVLQGVATVACFQIGAAYLGDVTEPGKRAVAFGWYTTAMGLGFTAGPLAGGLIAEAFGARASYGVAASISVLGALVAHRLLVEPARTGSVVPATRWYRQIGLLLKRHDLTLVALGNLLVSFTFAGAVSTFFPLYARNVDITQATIGTMFAVRAFVSAAGRIPNSIVTRAVGDQPVLLGALAVQTVVMFAVASSSSVLWLTVLLALEGLAFGAYLVAGQTWVADRTEIEYRGAAMGLYSAMGSVGGIAAPLTLGIVADSFGVATIFPVNGWLMALGSIGVLIGMRALSRTGPT